VLALVGGSGSGKTTALEVGAGLITPDRGRVLLGGREVSRRPERLRAEVAFGGCELDGPFDLEAGRWLATWASLDGVKAADFEARRADAVARFGLTQLDLPVRALSTGQRRRLGLVRVWVRAAPVTLLDAPGAGLDGDGLRRLAEAVTELAAAGRTVILADAAPHFVVEVADRALCFAAGAASDEVRRVAPDFPARVARAQGWQA
jgi:ABC-type multidrug transport system ATPase subunit